MAKAAAPVSSIAAAAGAADTGLFMIMRPGLFKTKPGRALSNLALLGGWTALAARSRSEGRRSSAVTVGLAASLFAANATMLAAHLAHRIAKPRVFLGPALSVIALADVLRRH
jgi:hypothetical protein